MGGTGKCSAKETLGLPYRYQNLSPLASLENGLKRVKGRSEEPSQEAVAVTQVRDVGDLDLDGS